jgi:hypothetical protein
LKKILIILFLTIGSTLLFAQTPLTIEGEVVYNTITDTWYGVNIPRNQPTTLIYRNNSITSINANGYMLQAGDEELSGANNNLDGEVISGNVFTWNGTDHLSITHGVFTGFNINAVLKYNYLENVPMGLIRKSNGMTSTSGGIAYNIVNKTQAVGIVVKGMNGVNIYNNTLFSDEPFWGGSGVGTYRGLIDIYINTDITPNGSARGTKIKNNIFYTKYRIYNIRVLEADCLYGFESDYNLFYCESGDPIFYYLGSVKTFAEWQALGYDTHSVIVNPNFKDFTGFVPNEQIWVPTGKEGFLKVQYGVLLILKPQIKMAHGRSEPEFIHHKEYQYQIFMLQLQVVHQLLHPITGHFSLLQRYCLQIPRINL